MTDTAPRIKSNFAQWQTKPGRPYSRIHWFRPNPKDLELSTPACGALPPDDVADFSLPPEPILTCESCIASIKRRDAKNGGRYD